MKRKYSKPEIIFENFSVNTSIAGNCEEKIDNQSRDICGYLMSDGSTIFLTGIDGCDYKEVTDSEDNGFCYHVPVDTNNLFNS